MPETSARPAAVRDLGDGYLGVWVSYDDRELAKALPGARWDKNLKCWRVSIYFRADAQSLVTALDMKRTSTSVVSVTTMLRELFAALPTHLQRASYRALAKAWHPDHGGDHGLMQQLNGAYEALR